MKFSKIKKKIKNNYSEKNRLPIKDTVINAVLLQGLFQDKFGLHFSELARARGK